MARERRESIGEPSPSHRLSVTQRKVQYYLRSASRILEYLPMRIEYLYADMPTATPTKHPVTDVTMASILSTFNIIVHATTYLLHDTSRTLQKWYTYRHTEEYSISQ